jgi:hypothetical protein
MTNEEIQKHIKQNCRYPDGTPAMDEQAFYEGAKWMRDQALRIHNAVERSERFGNVQKSDDPPNNDRPDWNGNCWNQI